MKILDLDLLLAQWHKKKIGSSHKYFCSLNKVFTQHYHGNIMIVVSQMHPQMLNAPIKIFLLLNAT